MKKIIIPVIVSSLFLSLCTVSYFFGEQFFAQRDQLNRPEVQWALEHSEEMKVIEESYEMVHKAADEVFYGILEQGKE